MLRYFLGLSLLTASIIAIRFFADKKISRKFQYALWILIPVYLCIAPFFTIDVSLPAKEIIIQEQATETVSVSDVNPVEGMPQPIQNSSHDETETVCVGNIEGVVMVMAKEHTNEVTGIFKCIVKRLSCAGTDG